MSINPNDGSSPRRRPSLLSTLILVDEHLRHVDSTYENSELERRLTPATQHLEARRRHRLTIPRYQSLPGQTYLFPNTPPGTTLPATEDHHDQ